MKRKRRLKNYLKLGIFLFGVSLFLFNCEKDDVELTTYQAIKDVVPLNMMSHRQKRDFLIEGLKTKILEYNINNDVENLFYKKYGEFDNKKSLAIKLNDKSTEFILVIPFIKPSLKNKKLLIAYYRNGERVYKIFNNNGYRDLIDKERIPFFLHELPLLFNLISNEVKFHERSARGECDLEWIATDYATCEDLYQNPCTGALYSISFLGKDEDCSDYGIEITTYVDDNNGGKGPHTYGGGGYASDIYVDGEQDGQNDWEYQDQSEDSIDCKGDKVEDINGKCVCPEAEDTDGNCVPDPCKYIKLQIQNPNYTLQANELKRKTGLRKETGYKQNKNGTQDSLNETNGGHSLKIPIDINTVGFMHTHLNDYLTGRLDPKTGNEISEEPIRMFSPADIIKFLQMVKNSKYNGTPTHLIYATMISSTGNYTLRFTGNIDSINSPNIKPPNEYKEIYKDYIKRKGREKGFLHFIKDILKVEGINFFRIRNNGDVEKKTLKVNGKVATDDCA